MHTYDKQLNGLTAPCLACNSMVELVQHHIYGRRYSEKCIWVCPTCHSKIHANPSWAYEKGFMIKRGNLEITKKSSKKTCLHKKTYFNGTRHVCQICHKNI